MTTTEAPSARQSPRREQTRLPAGACTGNLSYGQPVETGLALLIAVPPICCLLLIIGLPSTFSQLAAYLVPLGAAVSVLLCRRHVLVAVVAIAATVLLQETFGAELVPPPTIWIEIASLTPLIAVGVVYFSLGAALPQWPSLGWLAGSMVLSGSLLVGDAPFLMIAIGWWLVGRVFRSRQQVADELRLRAAELSAERERFVVEAVRLERTKIARELHDVVAHCMTVIVIQARAGHQLLDSDPVAAADAADVIGVVAAEAEADIGALVELMNPQQVAPLTRQLLDELVARATATGTSVTVDISGDLDDLGAEAAATAHRIVQEAITNSLRHAPGSAIRIDLRCNGSVKLDITNQPVASDDQLDRTAVSPLRLSGSGRGLAGIKERVAALGGEVTWGATTSGGWGVAARFPSSTSISPEPEESSCPSL